MTSDIAPSPDAFASLRLKKGEERRLRGGHLWVFSNEVDSERTPLRGFEPGQPASIVAADGKVIGTGYVNPHSLICARLVSRDPTRRLDTALLAERARAALQLRERLFAEPFYRVLYGEADGVPGLVVDRFGDVLVAQITTAGMERCREAIVEALDRVLAPTAILWRNDSAIRELEGLERYVAAAHGVVPEAVELVENGCRFRTAPLAGQKTGWFYDHRLNRARLSRYVSGARVLDLFSYSGAWGVQAALAGAREVVCVDSSASALELLATNAVLNGVGSRVAGVKADAFEALAGLRAGRERFDVVVLDPPAFIKRRKDQRQGAEAYRRLNQAALQVLEPGGILVSASCSHHLERHALMELLLRAARHVDRTVQIVEQGHQGPDHPVHPAIPETEYLKALFARAVPAAW